MFGLTLVRVILMNVGVSFMNVRAKVISGDLLIFMNVWVGFMNVRDSSGGFDECSGMFR